MAQEIDTYLPSHSTERMSYEEFLRSYDGTWAEWVDGQIVRLSPASKKHQLLVSFLAALFQFYVEANELGIVLTAPFQMKTGPELPGREPDILFVATENLERLKETYVAGAADLAVEVISPDSVVRDREEKFYEYEKGGVREYWLLDPLSRLAEFYRLVDRVYQPVALDEDGIYRSTVLPGFWLRVEWFWQEPLPTLMSVLKDWGLV
jgi:Uma2 family endonuclease